MANLHLSPASTDAAVFKKFPHLVRWGDDASFVIAPNLGHESEETLTKFTKGGKDKNIALTAWFVHPAQLAETVFAREDCRKDFLHALKQTSYVDAFDPKNSPVRHRNNQKRIREIEEESGIPYYASLLDFTPKDVDWLKKLRTTIANDLATKYGISVHSKVRFYFHGIIAEKTTTLHLHARVNQAMHPMEEDRSIGLDELICALEHGKTAKDLLLKKGCHYRESHGQELPAKAGMQVEEVDNPFVLSSPYRDTLFEANLDDYADIIDADIVGSPRDGYYFDQETTSQWRDLLDPVHSTDKKHPRVNETKGTKGRRG